jgi:hypothetical protein
MKCLKSWPKLAVVEQLLSKMIVICSIFGSLYQVVSREWKLVIVEYIRVQLVGTSAIHVDEFLIDSVFAPRRLNLTSWHSSKLRMLYSDIFGEGCHAR